jgi:hypothetical protein
MGPNELLLWMSARQRGSWAQFRSMVDDLGLREDDSSWSYQRFRSGLARHSHAVFRSELEWAVVPPVLAIGEIDGRAAGVLYGARTRRLLERIEGMAAPIECETMSVDEGADVVRMFGPSTAALAQAAGQVGVAVLDNAVRRLLAQTVPLRVPGASLPGGMPFGRDVTLERFVVGRRKCHWEEVKKAVPQEALELFRTSRWQIRDYYLFVDGVPQRTEGQCGKFLVLQSRRRQVMRYDAAAQKLRLPAICRPPLRVDRALTLCTGLPPAEETDPHNGTRILTYSGVASDVAGLAGEILHQNKL